MLNLLHAKFLEINNIMSAKSFRKGIVKTLVALALNYVKMAEFNPNCFW